MRRTALAIAVLTLGVGPWLAFPVGAFVAGPAVALAAPTGASAPVTRAPRAQVAPGGGTARAFNSPACTCREINVTATNIVRDAEVRSGDAEVVNRSITYIGPTYGEDEVEVEQEAEARSGDAIAGQILSVAGASDGCSRIHVRATNIVEEAEVRSGDATARNESLVLLDPSISRDDVDIDVDQDAEAESGAALAGQLIGIAGGGGPCGGVILDAVNRIRDVDVRSGEATMKNISKILKCETSACIEEAQRLLEDVDSVRVCDADGCRYVPVEEFVAQMEDDYAESGRGAGDAEIDADEPEPAPRERDDRDDRDDRDEPEQPDDRATDTAVQDGSGVSLSGAEE
jgi:hypothetical protein